MYNGEEKETSPYDMNTILEVQQLSERHLMLMEEIFMGIQRKLDLESVPCKCGCRMTMVSCYKASCGMKEGEVERS